ncbi:MAG: hypothetical protein ACP5NV_05210 [Candidatus Woesearchaeota archaeon]
MSTDKNFLKIESIKGRLFNNKGSKDDFKFIKYYKKIPTHTIRLAEKGSNDYLGFLWHLGQFKNTDLGYAEFISGIFPELEDALLKFSGSINPKSLDYTISTLKGDNISSIVARNENETYSGCIKYDNNSIDLSVSNFNIVKDSNPYNDLFYGKNIPNFFVLSNSL